jgi:hypothetical protein
MTTTTKKPEKTFRFAHIEVSVWKQQTSNGEIFLNANVSRSFKKGEEWRRTSSFGTRDIPVLIMQLKEALAFMNHEERPTLG